MASIKRRKARLKRSSKPPTNISQRHITRRIGGHQRASQKRKEARRQSRRQG